MDHVTRTGQNRLRWWHVLVTFVAVSVLLLLLPQRGVHGVDGNSFAVWVEEGDAAKYPRHAGYLWVCSLLFDALQWTGITGHDALLIGSALGSAAGLALLLLAFARLLPDRLPPLLVGLAVVATPSWFYFATTGEIAGVLAAGVGLVWWTFARFRDRPHVLGAAAVGASCAIAGALHALGHLLMPTVILAAVCLRTVTAGLRGQTAVQLIALVATHLGLAFAISRLLAHDAGGQASDAATVLSEYWQTFAPSTTAAVLWREWLVPHLPWSVGALVALMARPSRPFALAALAAVLVYLVPNVIFLGFYELHERGAYFAPVLPLAIVATARFVTRRGFVAVTLLGLLVTVLSVAPGWAHPVPPGFGAGVDALNQEKRIALVVANREELAGARTAARDLVLMELAQVVSAYEQQPEPKPAFAEWFDLWHEQLRLQGLQTVFSAAAGDVLETTNYPGLEDFWGGHLPAQYLLEAVEREGFRGTRLGPRPPK